MSQQNDLGQVALAPKGAFNATATYEQLDVVTYNGSSYLVLQTVTGVTPPNSAYYQTLASKGNNGANGEAATITAGSISMLPLGSSPTVTNSGTPNSAVFNFGIPYSPVSDNSVTTSKIANNAVTTNKINDGAVTFGKLGDNLQEYFEVNAITPIAEWFSVSNNYQTGEYVIVGGNNGLEPELYRFISNKPAGAWDASCVEFVNVCGELNKKVDSTEFDGAGIHSRTYVTEVAETTVTTESTDLHPSYYAYVAERGDYLVKGKPYRITLDGTQYIVPALRWFWSGSDGTTWWSKGVTFIGNLSLFCDTSGYCGELPNVPFVITNIYSLFPLVNEKIFLFTDTAGSHTVKIERIDYDMTKIPTSLVYGNELQPIQEKMQDGGNYTATSIGVNNMTNRASTFAFGGNNTVSGAAGVAVGNDNTASGQASICVGNRNESSGAGASAFGYNTLSSGSYSESHGAMTTASGMMSTTHGFKTISNHKSQFAFGEYNIADDSTANANSRGNYVEIVGNGTKTTPSNARTLDWSGNEKLAGSLTLGLGTANEVTITPQQLTQLLALLNN